jgi:hypothetical protein
VALFTNPHVRVLEGMNICDHPYVRHGQEIGLGEMSSDLVFEDVPSEVRKRLSGLLHQAD